MLAEMESLAATNGDREHGGLHLADGDQFRETSPGVKLFDFPCFLYLAAGTKGNDTKCNSLLLTALHEMEIADFKDRQTEDTVWK